MEGECVYGVCRRRILSSFPAHPSKPTGRQVTRVTVSACTMESKVQVPVCARSSLIAYIRLRVVSQCVKCK